MSVTAAPAATPASLVPRGLLLGITVVLVGLVFVVDSLGMLDARTGWALWPLALVIAGIAVQLQPGTGSRVTGIFLVVAGLWLLFNEIGIWTYAFWRTWPLILILLGAWIGYRTWRFRNDGVSGGPPEGGPCGTPPGPSGAIALLSHVTFQVPRGAAAGECSALLGDVLIDLGQPESDAPIAVDVLAIAGRVRVAIPPGWRVTLRVLALPGRAADMRDAGTVPAGTTGRTPQSDVVVQGTAVLGSVEIVTSTGAPALASA